MAHLSSLENGNRNQKISTLKAEQHMARFDFLVYQPPSFQDPHSPLHTREPCNWHGTLASGCELEGHYWPAVNLCGYTLKLCTSSTM